MANAHDICHSWGFIFDEIVFGYIQVKVFCLTLLERLYSDGILFIYSVSFVFFVFGFFLSSVCYLL